MQRCTGLSLFTAPLKPHSTFVLPSCKPAVMSAELAVISAFSLTSFVRDFSMASAVDPPSVQLKAVLGCMPVGAAHIRFQFLQQTH